MVGWNLRCIKQMHLRIKFSKAILQWFARWIVGLGTRIYKPSPKKTI